MADTQLVQLFTDIADAIRSKTGGSDPIAVTDTASTISNISAGGGFSNGTDWSLGNNVYTNIMCGHYANGIWLLGNYRGYIYNSENGQSWSEFLYLGDYIVNDIYYGCGTWMAATTNGIYHIMTGNTETGTVCGASGYTVNVVRYANGVWVAGANGRGIFYSTDNGTTWTQVLNGIYVYDLCYANGVWVAGTSAGLYRSIDNGVSWSRTSSTVSRYTKVHYANGMWMAGSDTANVNFVKSVNNGERWVTIRTDIVSDIQYANGVWIVLFSDSVYYTTNGKSWYESTFAVPYPLDNTTVLAHVYYSDGVWVLTDGGGDKVWYSVDNGATWTDATSNGNDGYTSGAMPQNVRFLQNGDGTWVAAGAYGIYYSMTWRKEE